MKDKPGIVAHVYNPEYSEAEAEGLQVGAKLGNLAI